MNALKRTICTNEMTIRVKAIISPRPKLFLQRNSTKPLNLRRKGTRERRKERGKVSCE